MKYTRTNAKKGIVEFEITIDKDEWEHALEHAYEEKKANYNVEGFRRGKAPRKMIEKVYGEAIFYDEALSHSFYHAYNEILSKETDFEPVDDPEISVKRVGIDGCVIHANVTVAPEVKLGKYKGLDVVRGEAKVSEKAVNDEINRVREGQARFVEVTGREVKDGDIANIDFKGMTDGKAFDGGSAEGYDLTLGSHTFIEGFEEQIVGMNVGDKRDINVTFPENYGEKSLAGKPAVFEVKLNAIKQKELPDLDDKFVSKVSECETVADYKKEVKAHLLEHEKEHRQAELENNIIEAVIKETDVEIPEVMISRELDRMMQDISYRLMYQGISLEDYAKYMGTTVEEIRNSRYEDAKRGVKISLVMQAIIKAEKMDVTDKDYESRLEEMAKNTGKTVEDVKKNTKGDQEARIKNDILLHKLLEFLVKNNEKKNS